MDFTLALTHFCEVHGPKSVLCTQVLPLECALCMPQSQSLRTRRSSESFATQTEGDERKLPIAGIHAAKRASMGFSGPSNVGELSTFTDLGSANPSIEHHPLFQRNNLGKDIDPQFRYGRAQGETCASCSFTVPREVAAKLPQGAPGSLKDGGKTKNGAPVLRSREFMCLGKERKRSRIGETSSSQESKASSVQSYASSVSHVDCHDHTLTYLTSKSPDDPENYAQLRASVIRALSCEVLPRGMSEGPFCFGDSNTGYTIAYVFRLTDPRARGRRRAYAFVALAGKDASRAFKACPMLWEAFTAMAKGIEEAAQRCQDHKQKKEEAVSQASQRNYTPASSFLTQRAVDPDGHPRRAGQTQPRSLAEIVGDENIFTILHQYFVTVLRCLGDKFGGLPFADRPSVYQTVMDEKGIGADKVPANVQTQPVDELDREDDKTPTPQLGKEEIEAATARLNKQLKRASQCAPIAAEAMPNRQVVA